MTALWQRTATEIAALVRSGEVTALEVADAHLERALAWNDHVNAFIHLEPEDIRTHAREIDRHIGLGHDPGPLAGVPVAIKDNICQMGAPTTCGSRMLETFTPPYDAHVVEQLRGAGALLFGKTNLDEFAMGSSTEHSAFGPSRNPYGLSRTPGGSSGGSAAAVAAGLVPLALGSDTGGSVRQPAAYCGIVGLKPTYGTVSRFGLVAFASSLDQIGPLARNVEDAELLLRVIAGHDARDATSSVRGATAVNKKSETRMRDLRIGIPTEYFGEGLAAEVRAAVGAAQAILVNRGAKCEEVSLPLTKQGIPVYYVVAPSEASSNLARYDGVRYGLRGDAKDVRGMFEETRGDGFGAEVKRRILLGTFALSSGYYDAYYGQAQKVRAALRLELDKVFESVDVLLTPTTPSVAFKLGDKLEDPLAMYLNDVYAVTANLTGVTAISLPCGRSSDGLPIGLQLMAPRFQEARLLQVARAYEAASKQGHKWPTDPTGGDVA